jgi:hypothetical protein
MPRPPSNPEPVIPSSDSELRQLSQWGHGGTLEQKLAQSLRQALFELIEDAIDWDKIGLLPGTFAGRKRVFQVQSIHFVRQETSGGQGGRIRLELPLSQSENAFIQSSQALQALILFRRTGDWDQAKGAEGLAAVLELAEACASEVIHQIRNLRGDNIEWDPIGGAVDLLLVGSALSGQLAPSVLNDEVLLDALFRPISQECSLGDDELRRLYKRLANNREALQELVRAHSTGSKGGAPGRFLNPNPLLIAIRAIRQRKWQLSRTPQSRVEPYDAVGEIYEVAAATLRSGLERERQARAHWLQRVEAGFGSDVNRQDVIGAVEGSIATVAAAGLSVRKDLIETLTNRLRDFSSVQFVAAVEATRRLLQADLPEADLPSYGRVHRTAVEAAEGLLAAWAAVLNRAEDEVEARRREYGGEQVERQAIRLKEALAGIADDLEKLERTRGIA